MKKILGVVLLVMGLCCSAWADQHTTVLGMQTKCGNATGVVPYLDGLNQPEYQIKTNNLITAAVRQLVKSVGDKGTFNYSVQLNRPSVISLLLKAQNNSKIGYQALNLDLTKGAEFPLTDFFVRNENMDKLLPGYESFILTEQGLFWRNKKGGKYDKFVPFGQIMGNVRIGEAGRLFQIAKITRKCENKFLQVPNHSLIAIKLDANATTGYKWDVELPSSGEVALVDSAYIIQRLEKQQVGVPGSQIMFFVPVKAGTYPLRFYYHRSWEKMNADQFKFTLIVKD